MKLAISGKGGVGKSTLAGAMALLLARRGRRVLAVDADPDGSLAAALGVPAELQRQIVPISQQKALIEQRTGAKVKQYGQMFKINPDVADVADRYALRHAGVDLLVLGAIEAGGSGCACPESVLLRALVQDLVLHKNDALVMDMEAGVEHLGRATARGVDRMVIVVEPDRRSLQSAARVTAMAEQIGLRRLEFVVNKVRGDGDLAFVAEQLDRPLLGAIPFDPALQKADRDERNVLDGATAETAKVFEAILDSLLAQGRP